MENKILLYGVDNDSIDFISKYNHSGERSSHFSLTCFVGKEMFLLGGFVVNKKIFEELKSKPIIFFAFKQKECAKNKDEEIWDYMTSINIDKINFENLTLKQRQIFNTLKKSTLALDW